MSRSQATLVPPRSLDAVEHSRPGDEVSTSTLQWQAPPEKLALRPGYTVGKRLGAGGSAEVFEAELRRPPLPPQRVALKRLLPGLRADPMQQRKLRREAQIGATLLHDNIVSTLELIDLGDEVALAMELVDGLPGQRLLALLTEHGFRLRPPLVGHILHGVFSALHYLQSLKPGQRPLVHADLSLENVMLARDGRVRLIDFGLSTEDGGSPESEDSDDALTALHEVGGKPSYAPPEGMPRVPTVVGDLYAAGVCAWELLSGRRFPVLPKGTGKRELGSVVAFAASGQPAQVWLLLRDCLALAPSERLQSAEQGLSVCARLREGHPTEAALAKLVRSLQLAGSDWLPPDALLPFLHRFDPTMDLADRLRQSFAAQQVEVFAHAAGDVMEPSLMIDPIPHAASQFVQQARVGQGRSRPSDDVLLAALDEGFATSADGLLCLRARVAGQRDLVVVLDPGPGCGYSATASALLRSILQ